MSVPKNYGVEAAMAADAGRSSSSRPKAPAGPEPPKDTRVKVLAAPNVLNPKEFVRIEALPGFDQREGKVLARSKTIYKSSEPPREQVFWENYHRRLKQFDKGLFTPLGKPYRELGEIAYTDPKQLTLYALGQLTEEPVEKDVQGKPPKEVAEVSTDKHSSKPECDHFQCDAPEPVMRPSPLMETGKELKTLSESLANSRAPLLLARLPESVKNDLYIQKILKKLEKYSKNPDLKIDPETFLKVLDDLRVWELCSPEIAAAVEFVRESIVRMPEEDFSKGFQRKVAPLSARIPSPSKSLAD